MIIRPKSPLGLKYLQIVPGDSPQGLEAGETIPLSAARPEPVDIDQFFDMFDEKTRTAIQRNNAGFGNAFAGRGPQINAAFGALRSLAEHGQPVLRTLVAPSTNFGGFWEALEDLSATVAPVAETQASMFVALDRTFAAFARVSRPFIQETIVKGPPTLDAVTADLPALRPFFRDSGRFFTALQARRPRAGRDLADDQRRPARRHPRAQPLAGAVRAARPDGGSAARLPGRARRLQRPRPADRHQRSARSGDQVHRAGADHLQLPQPRLPQPRRRLQRIERERQLAGRDRLRGADGPNAESAPASAPANGPGSQEPPPLQPLPERRTGQDGVCEAGNERYARARP